jgi:hypothetical protein
MDVSLPALFSFAYTMGFPLKELEDLIKKHGHKFHKLTLSYFDDLSILDACPALYAWGFALVGTVVSFHLLALRSLTG